MNYIPQMTNRRIGEVEILDLKGDFVGPWAMRGKEEISRFVEREKPKNLLINLKSVETIDSLGVKAIVDNLTTDLNCGVISGSYSVNEMFTRTETTSNVRFFKDEEEVIHYFAEELVKENSLPPTLEEKREYTRLRTALPLQFWYIQEGSEAESIIFHAIVTNLSQGGLYAEYLDMDASSENGAPLDPYDLKMLELKVKLPNGDEVQAEGKVVRIDQQSDQMGIGIEFYHISEQDKAKVMEFVRDF